MKRMSVLFNDEDYKRHTPTADLVVNVLQDFDSALVSYLESDTYHNEMVKIASTYSTLPYWQGIFNWNIVNFLRPYRRASSSARFSS